MELRRELLRRTMRVGLTTTVLLAAALGLWTLHDTRREVAATRSLVGATVQAVLDAQRGRHAESVTGSSAERAASATTNGSSQEWKPRHVTLQSVTDERSMPPPGWLDRLVDARVEYIALGHDDAPILRVGAHAANELTEHLVFAAAAFLALLGFGIAVTAAQYRSIVTAFAPVEVFVQRLREFESGRYEVRLPDPQVAELAPVARSFNHLADTLQTASAEQRRLAGELLSMREDERRRIARELHDDIGQSVTALTVDLALLRRQAADPVLEAGLSRLDEEVRRLRDTTRSLLGSLRGGDGSLPEHGPSSLLARWQGLRPDIRWMLADDVEERIQRLRLPAYRAACRVLQEAVTNAVRHAQATRVGIRVEGTPDSDSPPAALSVENDGVIAAHMPVAGDGLRGMHERALAIGAVLEAGPHPGGRWLVRLVFDAQR